MCVLRASDHRGGGRELMGPVGSVEGWDGRRRRAARWRVRRCGCERSELSFARASAVDSGYVSDISLALKA